MAEASSDNLLARLAGQGNAAGSDSVGRGGRLAAAAMPPRHNGPATKSSTNCLPSC